MFLRILFQQYHCVCADSLLASCEAELFGGGGFDGDIIDLAVRVSPFLRYKYRYSWGGGQHGKKEKGIS